MRPVLTALALTGALVLSAGASGSDPAGGRLFYLDISGGRVLSARPDGSDQKVIVSGHKTSPDGIAVDVKAGHVYWSNMGAASADDGSIERSDLDGRNVTTIVPTGGTFTAKQLKLDETHRKLYWSDREGMRVMRANLDGSGIETLVETGRGDQARRDAKNWCVGIAVDVEGGHIYWTQKGGSNANEGSIRRAALEILKGEDAAHRTDIEVLFDGLPEPIDLDLDPTARMIYWTDRGEAPRGNTVSRAPMDRPRGADPKRRADQEILLRDLREGIGIALDLPHRRMFVTDLGGSVYSASLDGASKRTILSSQGTLTGIAYVELP